MVAQRAVRPDGVGVDAPLFDQRSRLLQRVEDFSFKQFVALLAIETFVPAVLPKAARSAPVGLWSMSLNRKYIVWFGLYALLRITAPVPRVYEDTGVVMLVTELFQLGVR